MHDIHSVNNTSELGRLFTGDGDRQLRPHHHDIKCPRCDSLNTKFCYYNNYNLSQPRHFCKNCRRYWTKGGVLRNIPVGGGVRKTKRSDKSKPKTNNAYKSSHSEHSNSDTSSLTTTTTTANTTNTQFINFSESSTQSAKFELLTEGNNIAKEFADNIDMFQLNQHNEVQWIDCTPMYNDHCEDDQGLFDLTGSVDDQSYWSQSQWNDNQLNYFP